MADSIIITANVTDGAIINSNVTESTAVTANVVTGAKGDKGDTGATGAAGVVQAVTDGTGIDVDATDPASPIVSLDPASIASLALADSAIQSLSDLSITSTAAELNYTDGVTSAIQTQLDGKSATSHTHTAADTTDFDTEVSNNTDVAANTAARHTHANSAVLDATTASFTTADETKLDGIAAGAQVNTVTSVNTRTGAVTGLAEASDLTAHTGNTSNPHSVTKAQVGLGNVDNTSDANKPISTATQTALDGKFTQRTITGTANQITVTNGDGVAGNPTLSLPQDIHTGASPTFNTVTASLTGLASLNLPLTGGTLSGILNTSATFNSRSIIPWTDSAYTLGTSSVYWSNLYADRHYFNATAYLDGGSAGTANLTGALGILATSGSATHSLTLGSTSTGIALYNTSDQTTNYERTLIRYVSNELRIGGGWGGSGGVRVINISAFDSVTGGIRLNSSSVNGIVQSIFNTSTSGSITSLINGTLYASSGTQTAQSISPTFNQSATAGYTALLINPTETATGSGAKNLIDAQVGGVSKFKVTNGGMPELGVTGEGIVMKSPDGTRYKVTVANGGTIAVAAA